jgi:N-acetyl-gamma-glutamyl-phosphate reductase
MIEAGIVGGTGYTGVELLRILSHHPNVNIRVVTSRTDAGTPVADVYPNLRHHLNLSFSSPELHLLAECDLVFFATPNGIAMQMVDALLNKGVKVIDLSADFRLRDVAEWERWYGMSHACPARLKDAVYGLPEIHRARIQQAHLVACAGCYPTAVQLGFLPLLEQQLCTENSVIADVKSGVSGAGRKAELSTLMSETGESFKAYAASGHRHLPEITQGLTDAAGQPIQLTFVPHLVPMIRGIHATLYAKISLNISLEEIHARYQERYQNEPFVDVLPVNSHPDTRNVRGSNYCQIALHQPQGSTTLVILSVLDNLVKGASGQAVQIMNLMYDLPETTGLTNPALYP